MKEQTLLGLALVLFGSILNGSFAEVPGFWCWPARVLVPGEERQFTSHEGPGVFIPLPE